MSGDATPRPRHVFLMPERAPRALAALGICACSGCRVASAERPSVAWAHFKEQKYAGSGTWVDAPRHTERWRKLSWCVGDEGADWLCAWCDTQPAPEEALDALLSAAMLWEEARGARRAAMVEPTTADKLYALVLALAGLDGGPSSEQAPPA